MDFRSIDTSGNPRASALDSKTVNKESDVEFRVNRDRALELQKQSTSMMAAVEILEKGYEDLEGNDDDLSKPKLVELVQEIEDYQESIKELESTFKKYNAIASNRGLKGRIQVFTQNARTSLDLSKQQLREIRNKYKQDTTENEQDVLDKATEQYETDEEKCNAMKEISRYLLKETNDLKAEVITLKGNVEAAAITNNTCYDRIKELENELQDLKSTNTMLNNQIKEKDRTTEDLKKLYDEQISENKQNEDTTASYEKQIEQLKKELKNESGGKESEIQKHKPENETFASTFRDKFDELKTLKIDLTCKSKENAVLTLKLSDMQKEIEKKGSDLRKYMLKNEALVTTVWENYVKIRTLEAEVEALI